MDLRRLKSSLRSGIATSLVACSALLLLTACGERPTGETESPRYAYGTVIDFSQAGPANAYRASGWNKPEEKFTWSDGNTAVLRVPIEPTTDRVTLRIMASGLVKEPELPFQPVEVHLNDEKVADWQVGNTASFSVPIPESLSRKGGDLTVTFKIPKAASPKQLGTSEDVRVLGLCVHNFEISKS